MLEEIAKHLLGESKVIAAAPVAFSAAVLMATALTTVIAWVAFRWAYGARLENKDSLITLRNAQLDDYREKLVGASPEEAKDRINALEAQLQQLASDFAPRTLTEAQLVSLRDRIRTIGPHRISVVHDLSVPDGRHLAEIFARVFTNAGWTVHMPAMLGSGISPASGVALLVGNPEALSPVEGAVAQILRDIKVGFDIHQSHFQTTGPMATDVALLIGSRTR
jgi:hypothetical protein